MKLILVDDNAIFRDNLKMYLEIELNHKVIAEAESGEEFLKLKNIVTADVILMDLNMGKLDGLQTTKTILEEYPHLKIIAVTFDIQNSFLRKIIETGFKGFVNKTDIFNKLKPTLHSVYEGKYSFPSELLLKY